MSVPFKGYVQFKLLSPFLGRRYAIFNPTSNHGVECYRLPVRLLFHNIFKAFKKSNSSRITTDRILRHIMFFVGHPLLCKLTIKFK